MTEAIAVPREDAVNDRILLVEDEPGISDAVVYALRGEGFAVDAIRDGEAALNAPVDDYELIILDVVLPGISGLEVCRRTRKRSPVPILMLTARIGELDRVVGLDAGADDYVTKPFSMPELVGRVRAILRRRMLDRGDSSSTRRRVGSLSIDLAEQSVRVNGRLVELTPTEFKLLAQLAGEPERAFSRRELAERFARRATPADERACDVHVKNIRRKLEADPSRPRLLVTVRGVGYMLRRA